MDATKRLYEKDKRISELELLMREILEESKYYGNLSKNHRAILHKVSVIAGAALTKGNQNAD